MRDLLLLFSRSAWGIWRYRWYAATVAWLVCLGGWMYVQSLPDTYTASARVYIDTDSLLRPMLKGLAITTNASRRIELITKTFLSRPNLEKLARMTDLDISVTTDAQAERMFRDLKAGIKLASAPRSPNLYTVSYSSHNPQLAKRVVQSLLTILVESTLGQGRSDVDNAQEFVNRQISIHEQLLSEAEQRLADFKRENMGQMPREGGNFYSTMGAVQSELAAAKLELDEAVQRRNELDRQIQDMLDTEEEFDFASEETAVSAARPEYQSERVRELRVRLDELLLRYTQRHPDVVELQRLIVAVEASERPESQGELVPDSDPVRQHMQLLMVDANSQIAALKVRVAEMEGRAGLLRDRVDTTLEVEQRLSRLNRDYGVIKNNYNQLLSRRAGAQLGEDAEVSGGQVSFRTVDPPHVPPKPSGPNRLLFMTIALGLGLAAGIGFAFLLSQFRPTFTDSLLLGQVTELPILGSVSAVAIKEYVWKQRLGALGFSATCAALLTTYAGVMTLETLGNPWLSRISSLAGMLQ